MAENLCHFPLFAKVCLVMILGFFTVWTVYPAVWSLTYTSSDVNIGLQRLRVGRQYPRLLGYGLLGLSLLCLGLGLVLALSFGWCYAIGEQLQ